jgi:uncharacterized CHY-type Zn-finger protein
MTKRLLYYNPHRLNQPASQRLPGIRRFSQLFAVIDRTISLVDRTHTLTLPVGVHSLFPLPALIPLARTFEDLCNERAVELLRRAEALNVRLYVFWSGGIDSTLVLVSLLKNATPRQLTNLVVLMSQESISEYPKFYNEYIRGKLQVDSSVMFPYLLGGRHLVVNGEHNDQLFGSDMVGKLVVRFGAEVMHRPYDRDLFFRFFDGNINDRDATNFSLDRFEQLRAAAPVPITTNYLHLWWISFAMKWQAVFMRTLAYTSPRQVSNIDLGYLNTYYAPFYCTDAFQLWSMTNLDQKIKDKWSTYKWVCKDIIYDFTKDADYRDNKIKRGSLYFLLLQQTPYYFIDANMTFSREMHPSEYHVPVNDFVDEQDKTSQAAA